MDLDLTSDLVSEISSIDLGCLSFQSLTFLLSVTLRVIISDLVWKSQSMICNVCSLDLLRYSDLLKFPELEPQLDF